MKPLNAILILVFFSSKFAHAQSIKSIGKIDSICSSIDKNDPFALKITVKSRNINAVELFRISVDTLTHRFIKVKKPVQNKNDMAIYYFLNKSLILVRFVPNNDTGLDKTADIYFNGREIFHINGDQHLKKNAKYFLAQSDSFLHYAKFVWANKYDPYPKN